MNITVYLGANAGNDPALAEAVRELGSWIGANGHRLVYGGSRSGLMGQLAQSALDAGGTVTGVEPQFFVQQELQHDGLTELIVTVRTIISRFSCGRFFSSRKALILRGIISPSRFPVSVEDFNSDFSRAATLPGTPSVAMMDAATRYTRSRSLKPFSF